MKEIGCAIELKTNTETELLRFETRYLVDANFTFHLSVISAGYGGTSNFCVRRNQVEKMCSDLMNMHLSLSGMTTLDDNESDGFVKFEIEQNGWLNVRGQVGGTHEDHFVKFKFRTDQTCITPFVSDFKSLLKYQYD